MDTATFPLAIIEKPQAEPKGFTLVRHTKIIEEKVSKIGKGRRTFAARAARVRKHRDGHLPYRTLDELRIQLTKAYQDAGFSVIAVMPGRSCLKELDIEINSVSEHLVVKLKTDTFREVLDICGVVRRFSHTQKLEAYLTNPDTNKHRKINKKIKSLTPEDLVGRNTILISKRADIIEEKQSVSEFLSHLVAEAKRHKIELTDALILAEFTYVKGNVEYGYGYFSEGFEINTSVTNDSYEIAVRLLPTFYGGSSNVSNFRRILDAVRLFACEFKFDLSIREERISLNPKVVQDFH